MFKPDLNKHLDMIIIVIEKKLCYLILSSRGCYISAITLAGVSLHSSHFQPNKKNLLFNGFGSRVFIPDFLIYLSAYFNGILGLLIAVTVLNRFSRPLYDESKQLVYIKMLKVD